MNILVFGANGGTGKAFVQQACKSGHQVTAFSSDPELHKQVHENLKFVQGDSLHRDDVRQAIPGHHAIVSCLGPKGMEESSALSDAVSHMIAAMEEQGVRRIIYLSTAGIHKEIPGLSAFIGRFFLQYVFADHRQAYEQLERSSLNWTVVRPMRLIDGPLMGNYRTSMQGIPKGGKVVSREDTAHYLLKVLEQQEAIQASVGLAY